ncbi:unnamed protein product [Bursaphelenchus okinawaensis]|uniref:Uncharacterized protein n=1 Tax=Bursaphelenchus okinawaensis TaxID=465554 RepID=A0A811LMT3_9BILA|nr:unnamed protein product [Bursaphelenchus okinawaensis]CAG9125379.1 unnamed protein product [Bursaphelenchus okinawaensis]
MTEPLSSSRPRRSAGVKATQAWATLMPSKKFNEYGEPEQSPQQEKVLEKKLIKREVAEKPPVDESVVIKQEKVASNTVTVASDGRYGQGLLTKQRLEDIEKEMNETYNSEKDTEEFEYERHSTRSFTYRDDEDDEDYNYAKEVGHQAPSDSTKKRGRPLGSKSTYTKRKSVERRPIPDYSRGGNIVYPRSIRPLENRPIKIIMRQNFNRPRQTFLSSQVQQQPQPIVQSTTSANTMSSMAVSAKREVDELSKKYGQKIVAGDSVGKFNDLNATLLDQMKLISEDRNRLYANYQETVEQLNLAHTTALDLKDSRIRQLENLVNELQAKNFKLTTQLNEAYCLHKGQTKVVKDGEPASKMARVGQELTDSPEAAAERESLEEFNHENSTEMA